MGALIDGASTRVVGMALTKGDEAPDKPPIGLRQLKNEAVGRGGSPFLAEWDIELPTTGEPRTVTAFRFAWPPGEPHSPGLDFSPSAFGPQSRAGAGGEALDLLRPLVTTEDDRGGRQFLAGTRHASNDTAPRHPFPQTNFLREGQRLQAGATPRRRLARRRPAAPLSPPRTLAL